MTDTTIVPMDEMESGSALVPQSSLSLSLIPHQAQGLLLRMFADPRTLAKEETTKLVSHLRECVEKYPEVSDLRVVYGMALCVNLEVNEAMEELAEAVALAPDSFMAHFKMGELWMRLRVCTKAKDHTHQAAILAQNMAQSEMARRQATALRTMMREGVERDGYRTPWLSLGRLRRLWHRSRNEELATVEAQ